MIQKISDVYIVESLLQSTEACLEPLRWREIEQAGHSGQGFIAQIGSVRITLNNVPGITGSRLWLTLSDEHDKVHVQEPQAVGLWGRQYRCEDEQRLAGALQRLRGAVARQCQRREARAAEDGERIRARIFNQLLFRGSGLPSSE